MHVFVSSSAPSGANTWYQTSSSNPGHSVTATPSSAAPTPHHPYTRLNRARGAMEPSLKQILDALNSRFEEFDRRLDDRDRVFADRTGSVDSRFTTLETSISTQAIGLERRLAGIESRLSDPVSASIEQRLASLEASFADGHDHRLTTLETSNDVTVKLEFDPRVAALEKVSTDLAVWRPGIDGVLDDIQKDV